MRTLKYGVLGVSALAIAACAPQSAQEARGDPHLTAGAAAAASQEAAAESRKMAPVASDIIMDVNNIKEIESWFDLRRSVSFD